MAKRMGRPPKDPEKKKRGFLQVRVDDAEKQTFQAAADLAGLDVSAWVRERLRTVAPTGTGCSELARPVCRPTKGVTNTVGSAPNCFPPPRPVG